MKKKPKTKSTKKPKQAIPLIDILQKAFDSAGMITETGRLSDCSGAWLEIRKTNEVENLKRHSFVFSFDDSGKNITDLSLYQENFIPDVPKKLY